MVLAGGSPLTAANSTTSLKPKVFISTMNSTWTKIGLKKTVKDTN